MTEKDIETVIKTELELQIQDNPEQVKEILRNALRFYVLVKFLNNYPNKELMQYDICNKYREEYKTANPVRRKELEKKSKEKGKYGWNIGVNEKVILSCPRLSESHESKGKYEQQFAHIRTGHLHAVRFGKGKKDVKVIWYRPIIVNKNLPFKELL